MTQQRSIAVLHNPTVRLALKQAWEDSKPGAIGGREAGGFILRDAAGRLSAIRWPKGTQNTIEMLPHPHCKVEGKDIVITFHTHPNTGSDYLQEPSETDKSAVRDDPDLKGEFYLGEFVVSQARIYLIEPDGRVSDAGDAQAILAEG